MQTHRLKPIAFLAALAVLIGLPILIFSTQVNEQNQQNAAFQDLNTGDQISQTNNPDGTMGPPDWTGNYSNAIDPSQTGTLTFLVTDPQQDGKPTGFPIFNQVAVPTHKPLPTQSQGQAEGRELVQPNPTHAMPTLPQTTPTLQGTSPTVAVTQPVAGGPQAVTALVLTMSKVEVHVAYVTSQNKPLDTWETLNLGGPKTVDLVQLAKGGLASLGLTKLVAGQYTEVRLYITNASATLPDGTKISLDIPGKFNIVRVIHPFTILPGVNTNITMDFDAQNSVIKAGDQYKLKPVVANFLESRPDVTAAPSPMPSIHPTLAMTITPAPGCHYQVCTMACPVTNPNCCPHILLCPSGIPHPTCLPRPACLDATPRCTIPEPAGGWCPQTTSSITLAPISPQITCVPRPACLDATPKCQIPEPAGGWCSATTSGQLSNGQMNSLIQYINNLLRSLLGRK